MVLYKVGTWLTVHDITDGRDGPFFVAKLPAEHAPGWLSTGLSRQPLHILPSSEQLLTAWRHGYSPGETEYAGVEDPCLQAAGDGPEVVSVAGEVQAAPTWRDNRERPLWVRHSGKALAGYVRLRASLGRATGWDSAWDTGTLVI